MIIFTVHWPPVCLLFSSLFSHLGHSHLLCGLLCRPPQLSVAICPEAPVLQVQVRHARLSWFHQYRRVLVINTCIVSEQLCPSSRSWSNVTAQLCKKRRRFGRTELGRDVKRAPRLHIRGKMSSSDWIHHHESTGLKGYSNISVTRRSSLEFYPR